MRTTLLTIIFLLLLTAFAQAQETSTIKIGVLAKRGKDVSMQRWDTTAQYLTTNIPEYQFEIVPLSFKEVESAVVTQQIDYLLANSGIYTDLSTRYSVERILTIKRSLRGKSNISYGSVIFTNSKNTSINNLKNLKGLSFAAVSESSFGGWIAAWRELVNDGINPADDFSSLTFLETHDAVVYAVLKGQVDAGSVRTDTIERMADEGKIDIKDISVIASSALKNSSEMNLQKFPFLLSTRLYPEWPLAKLPHISNDLAEKISSILMSITKDSPAAMDAKIVGWTIPQNYREIDRTFQELRLGIYVNLGNFSLWDSIVKYWRAFLLGGFCFITMIGITIYICVLNIRLKESERRMSQMASHDDLTNLPNRNLLLEFSEKSFALAHRENKEMAILFIDLDNFKHVNDTYGHQRGDELLQRVANRLRVHLRKEDIMARLGGDEFAGLLYNVRSLKEIATTADRIILDISSPYFFPDGEISIGCSIGVSIYPTHGDNIENLLQQADKALYKAKKQGRGKVSICNLNP